MIVVALLLLQLSPVSPVVRPCYIENRENGRTYRTYVADRKCEEFEPPRTLSGIWMDGYEGSVFYEGVTDIAKLGTSRRDVWLTIDGTTLMPPGFKRRFQSDFYFIRFRGRRARTEPGASSPGYGHFGMFSRMVKADRILQITKSKLVTGRRSARTTR